MGGKGGIGGRGDMGGIRHYSVCYIKKTANQIKLAFPLESGCLELYVGYFNSDSEPAFGLKRERAL